MAKRHNQALRIDEIHRLQLRQDINKKIFWGGLTHTNLNWSVNDAHLTESAGDGYSWLGDKTMKDDVFYLLRKNYEICLSREQQWLNKFSKVKLAQPKDIENVNANEIYRKNFQLFLIKSYAQEPNFLLLTELMTNGFNARVNGIYKRKFSSAIEKIMGNMSMNSWGKSEKEQQERAYDSLDYALRKVFPLMKASKKQKSQFAHGNNRAAADNLVALINEALSKTLKQNDNEQTLPSLSADVSQYFYQGLKTLQLGKAIKTTNANRVNKLTFSKRTLNDFKRIIITTLVKDVVPKLPEDEAQALQIALRSIGIEINATSFVPMQLKIETELSDKLKESGINYSNATSISQLIKLLVNNAGKNSGNIAFLEQLSDKAMDEWIQTIESQLTTNSQIAWKKQYNNVRTILLNSQSFNMKTKYDIIDILYNDAASNKALGVVGEVAGALIPYLFSSSEQGFVKSYLTSTMHTQFGTEELAVDVVVQFNQSILGIQVKRYNTDLHLEDFSSTGNIEISQTNELKKYFGEDVGYIQFLTANEEIIANEYGQATTNNLIYDVATAHFPSFFRIKQEDLPSNAGDLLQVRSDIILIKNQFIPMSFFIHKFYIEAFKQLRQGAERQQAFFDIEGDVAETPLTTKHSDSVPIKTILPNLKKTIKFSGLNIKAYI